MKPADQPGAKRWGGPNYADLPVVHATQEGLPVMVTAWELTEAEVAQVVDSGRIWLMVAGEVHPPVMLTTVAPYE